MPILAVAPPESPPFAVDAIVLEEDRWLVLSAPPIVRDTPIEHPIRVHTALVEATARELGEVVVQRARWLAVVHDLDRDPTTTIADVARALARIVEMCRETKLERLGLPLLGTEHGRLDREAVLREIRASGIMSVESPLRALWLISRATIAL